MAAQKTVEKQDPEQNANYSVPPTHRVAPGDTVSGISHKYEVPEETILKLNPIEKSGLIRIGQVLKLR